MRPLLIDEGLPHAIADAFRLLGIDAAAIGDSGAPARESLDLVNCEWCAEHNAVIVTNDRAKGDRGKGNRDILTALAKTGVDAIFVFNDLRWEAPHVLARALLCSEAAMDQLASQRNPIRHRLSPAGKLKQKVNR